MLLRSGDAPYSSAGVTFAIVFSGVAASTGAKVGAAAGFAALDFRLSTFFFAAALGVESMARLGCIDARVDCDFGCDGIGGGGGGGGGGPTSVGTLLALQIRRCSSSSLGHPGPQSEAWAVRVLETEEYTTGGGGTFVRVEVDRRFGPDSLVDRGGAATTFCSLGVAGGRGGRILFQTFVSLTTED